ncbi:MAG: CoB--CoM heterodisulfide reductase iron-sulfur subunit A family protein [Deltaproteobacteria bacterium]|nr:MAG: CoB--CoM heterodisulfide reductase iron-sulfur subunit A family protein [Deltaproteobacteria bacterium]
MADRDKESEMQSERKVGVYVCRCGGNISDHVDVEKVCEEARKITGVVVAREDMFMCSDPGQYLIIEDLKNGTIDRVVVASCAPDLHEMTFRNAISRAGANSYVYEHANIREQVSWVHHGEKATNKAARLVAAASAKAKQLEPLEPIRVEAKRQAVVIGGGIAGMRAAKDLATRGIKVTLLEKSPFLGGRAAQLHRVAPTGELASNLVVELADEVLVDPAITVYTCAQVTEFEGYVGNFKLGFKREPPESNEDRDKIKAMRESNKGLGEFVPLVGVCPAEIPQTIKELTIEAGVIVLATGFRPYTPRKGEYGFGEFNEVITLPDLVKIMAESEKNGRYLEVKGREIKSLAMIHCVGSRQIPGIHEEDETGYMNEYCSRTCCTATLHAANTIRETYPETRVFDFYRDIRTYGRGQEELYEEASKNKVLFLRFEAAEAPVVTQNGGSNDHPLSITVKDTLTFGEEVEIPVDLVVLAVGMEPNNVSDLAAMMKLPVGADRFLQEVHPKLRPVELSVAGVLLAGTCQSPMDMGEACNGASSAAVKASSLLGRGYVELDPFVAEVNMDLCVGTGACVEACLQEGALQMVEVEEDGKKVQRAEVNPALCTGCGACVAVCPENAINVKGWTLKQYEAMVDMIVSDEIAV